MKPGELYTTDPTHFLMVYPSQEKADLRMAADTAGSAGWRRAEANAVYWSQRLNCQIRTVEPGSVFMVLSNSGQSMRVLFADFDGWIVMTTWLKFHKLTS